ncbi:MAG: PAS domain-containing protein [Promethearchaeota archaeon]
MSSNLKNDEKEPKISNSIEKYVNHSKWNFIDKIPLPIIIIDDNCRIVKLNQLAISLFKYDKIELLDKNFLELCESCYPGTECFKVSIKEGVYYKDTIKQKEI